MGRSPDLVEDQVTYPIVTALRAAPGVQYVRGLSMPGDSFVYVVFKEGVDLYWARSRVLEYLAALRAKLPENVSPQLGPDATSVGWVFEYALVDSTGRHDLSQLRSFQDWTLRYWLQGVDGVAEVASIGGFVKQYQADLDPAKLQSYGVSVREVADAIRRSNNDVGGGVVEISEHEHFVRGRGYIKSVADVEQIPIKLGSGGVPVMLADIATVHLGPEPRRGMAVEIGKMVDDSSIMVKIVHKKLERWEEGGRRGSRDAAIIEGLKEVGHPIFFALLVVTDSFLPIFTLQGTEGRLFKPLAFTKTFSMAFAAVLAITLTPALAAWFVRGRIRPEHEHPLSRSIVANYA